MFGRLILETYVQDRCRDVRFKDEHLTWFEIKKERCEADCEENGVGEPGRFSEQLHLG